MCVRAAVNPCPYPTTSCALQRRKLGQNLTPVTHETFAKMRMNKREAAKADVQVAVEKSGGISARDLFRYHPEWFQDSDEEEEE